MFGLVRFAISLMMLAAFAWFAVTVPLGKRTLWGHLHAIFATQEAKDLAEGTKEEAERVARKVKEELHRPDMARSDDDPAPKSSAAAPKSTGPTSKSSAAASKSIAPTSKSTPPAARSSAPASSPAAPSAKASADASQDPPAKHRHVKLPLPPN